MSINIFKNLNFYKNLQCHEKVIRDVCSNYTYNHDGPYDLENKKVSRWFDPDSVKKLPLSRCYPNCDSKVREDERYNLILYVSNYLPLFLVDLLYKDKHILIEDFGAGMGRLIFYLSKLGFDNFHAIDNFSQICPSMLEDLMKAGDIKYKLNDFKTTKPIVVNNCSSPTIFITSRFSESIELVCFYTNRRWEEMMKTGKWKEVWKPKEKIFDKLRKNFVFLCKDEDDLAVAYCREDKFEKFKSKLKEYEI